MRDDTTVKTAVVDKEERRRDTSREERKRDRNDRSRERRSNSFGWSKKKVPTSRSGRIIKGRGVFVSIKIHFYCNINVS